MKRLVTLDFISFAGTFLALIAIAVGAMAYIAQSDVRGEQAIVTRIVAEHEADTFGGETPRDTLDLFIAALKAGDTNLAARYFIIENQDAILADLIEGKRNGVLPLIIRDLEQTDSGREIFEGYFRFSATIDDGIVLTYDLVYDDAAGIWKLESL